MSKTIDVAGVASLSDVGFLGGRDDFRTFCRSIFQSDTPRFLKNALGQLVVFRHADLQAFGVAPAVGALPIARLYPDTYGKAGVPGAEVARVIGAQVFTANPPLHRPARRILTTWLGAKGVSLMEDPARAAAQSVVDGLGERGEVDAVRALAEKLTVGFWASLLKLSPAEAEAIGRCTEVMTLLFGFNRSADDLAALDRAFAEYAAILERAAERGLAAGDPSLIAMRAQLEALRFEDDPAGAGVVPKTVGEMLAGNLIDGFHTAALATANTLQALLAHPDVLARAAQHPELLPRAIAEALRLEPPVLLLKRFLLSDFHHDGLLVPKGSAVVMFWAAGNHDPSVFPDPERFDLARNHRGLTTFGLGAHICPGRNVAVMLTRVLIETLLASRTVLEPGAAAAKWIPAHAMAQLRHMPVRIARCPR